MFYRALKSVLLFALTLSISSMAAESLASSSSAQSKSAATLESTSPSVQSSSSASVPAKPLSKWQTLPEINAPWMKGERLEYELSWGFVTAGYATLEVKPRKDGKVEFETYATANKTVNKFYPVHDTVYTLVHKRGLMTDVFRKSLHEGTFHNKSLIRFNRDDKKAVLSDTVFKDPVKHYVKRSADTSVTIDGLEHSIMSAFYLVRTLPLKEGATSRFAAVSGKKRYELKVITHKRETIKTDLGSFKTVKVEPVLDGDGIFNSSGRIFIWFTDDEKRIPVLMQCEIKLGSIKATLTKVK
ncbi:MULTISPECIES: DUF3108 domain-containing protein [Fibrobacter]|jgi:hypothetical protein|uniref:DUF3108 domain-containing protein n=1 Tax=Fibrobacter succinogenes TaxID=833 RepID=A0A380S7A1_FIBSU|nr:MULTISPECIES: DUF3108 domain-containing protein [Fibrobacter]PWJ34902.1 uncharacterized protein DUF3108 [Fibrobacter succinogenes subsp. elongatus]SUQ25025.1 Protein of unknown function [Fibrobacter succinogenes]